MVPRPDGASGATQDHLPAAGPRAGRRGIARAVPAGMPRSRPFCRASGRGACGSSIAARSARRWPGCTSRVPTTQPRRVNALGSHGWRPLLDRCRARADEVQPNLAAELDAALTEILAAWPAALPDGHIHADLFPDNVFFLDDHLSGLIDFYFAATDFLAYDVGDLPERLVLRGGFFVQRHQGTRHAARLRSGPSAVGRGAGGSAGAVPGGCDSFPADTAVRLGEHAGRRDGHPQGPHGISAPLALPPSAARDEHAYGI